MAPIDVLHFLVAYELVHLLHKNHTTALCNAVNNVILKYSESLNWPKYSAQG